MITLLVLSVVCHRLFERLSALLAYILSTVLQLDWLQSPCACPSRPSLELQIRIGKLSIAEEAYVSAESCSPRTLSVSGKLCLLTESGRAGCILTRLVPFGQLSG